MKLLSGKAVTLTRDACTNIRHQKVRQFCEFMPSNCSVLAKRRLRFGELYLQLSLHFNSKVVAEVEGASALVVDIATDNARNMTSAVDSVCSPPMHAMFLIRCAAHSMSLVMKDLLDKKGLLTTALEFMEQIIDAFQSSQSLRRSLNEKQEQLGLGIRKALNLVRPTDTRWHSKPRAVIRIVKLAVPDEEWVRDDLGWKALKDAIAVLEPFQNALDTMQQDKATCLQIWKQNRKAEARLGLPGHSISIS